MDIEAYYKSLTTEFESLKDRIRNFIGLEHLPTDGEWKESVLRSMLRRNLPERTKIGRGFVLTKDGPTTQCDLLLYDSEAPVLFRDGELVILTPDAVRGIIEVKTNTTTQILRDALDKSSAIGMKLGYQRAKCFFALFSYENSVPDDQAVLRELQQRCDLEGKIVDLICLGCSTFVKWWECAPDDTAHAEKYLRWHSYRLEDMAAGYFMNNVLDYVAPKSIGKNAGLWFPEAGKESKKTGDIAFRPLQTAGPPAHFIA